MSFLSELKFSEQKTDYEPLGYLQNPFRGKVCPEIYVERPELEPLRQHLLGFLSDEKKTGGFWAMEGARGLGKSNFLQHLDWELQKAQQSGDLKYTVHQYIPSQLIAPQQLIEKIIQAIGEELFYELLKNKPTLPASTKGTDLARFFDTIFREFKKVQKQQSLFDEEHNQNLGESTRFLMRWMSGHQTYTHERKKYNLWSTERMPPAVAFPYLRTILECLDSLGLVKRLILLLDEFEDVQSLKLPAKSEYIQALKGLINSFNWRGLFVIIAGQEGSFSTIGGQYPSLSDRWQLAGLLPIRSATEAVNLARAYMVSAHQAYLQVEHNQKIELLSPSDVEIKAIYGDIVSPESGRVSQRDILDKLYQWVEKRCHPRD